MFSGAAFKFEMRVEMRCCVCFVGPSFVGRVGWSLIGVLVVMLLLRCFYELFSRSEQQFHMCSAEEARGWTPPEEFAPWLRGADLQERHTKRALASFEEMPRFGEGVWREELSGPQRGR